MCGIVAHAASNHASGDVAAALRSLAHRGPDGEGIWQSKSGRCVLAHRRLKILDLSEQGRQPMRSQDGRYTLVLNGEIYNCLELSDTLQSQHNFVSHSDTEVLLAAFAAWGPACLERCLGMFSLVVWDDHEQALFAARDRFGVKPLYYAQTAAGLWLASEIKALHQAGVPRQPDVSTWSTYLGRGLYDHSDATFWQSIKALPAGHALRWCADAAPKITPWYSLAARVGAAGQDERAADVVKEEVLALLHDTMHLRRRSDVPLGLCLSGGLDSSLAWALLRPHASLTTYTFHCDSPAYDESARVKQLLQSNINNARFCALRASDVPALAVRVQAMQDEPFGGIPTLAMAQVHAQAQRDGVVVLIDGNGLDEAWAGYDYYNHPESVDVDAGPVQGSGAPAMQSSVLFSDFAALAQPRLVLPKHPDPLVQLQLRDIMQAKIPRAMRFADRVSMGFGRELREPFLDHRLVELGLRQPRQHKIVGTQGKTLIRALAAPLLPDLMQIAPKQAVQTPQREWLRGPLRPWADALIEQGLAGWGKNWLNAPAVRQAWRQFAEGAGDNSFAIWQWLNLGLMQ